MNKQRQYTNGAVYSPDHHKEARETLGGRYTEYGNFSPALNDNSAGRCVSRRSFTLGRWRYEIYEMRCNGGTEEWLRYLPADC